MRTTLYITAMLTLALFVSAFTNPKVDFKSDGQEGIQFHEGSWSEVLQQAKAENKIIFLDVHATWCGPCKMLKKNTFSNAKVGDFYNENFINVELNGELGDGLKLMKKYRLNSYPSLLFINGDGEIVSQTGGYYKPNDFLKIGKRVKAN